MVVALQLATIVASRGDVYLLGEAYAFGVIWSFLMKGTGVLALRFQRTGQEYKTPLNFRVAGREIPAGLILTTGVLLLVAVANLLTKQIATIYGVTFSLVLMVLFTVSEHINRRRQLAEAGALEEFNLQYDPQIDPERLHARPGCVLVAIRDYHRMYHLRKVLEKTNLRRHDIVVMTVRPIQAGAAEYELAESQLFSDYERELFSHVVSLAEKEGKRVELLVVPGVDPFDAMVQTAARLQASRLVTGVSERMTSEELAVRIGRAWERLPEPRHPFSLEIISPGRASSFVNLGPHPPRLWPEDLDLLHKLWLRLSGDERLGSRLHHRDVVGVALRRLERDLENERAAEVIEEMQREIRKD
jgi:nucleotide-binding universal stress UspA family protein